MGVKKSAKTRAKEEKEKQRNRLLLNITVAKDYQAWLKVNIFKGLCNC